MCPQKSSIGRPLIRFSGRINIQYWVITRTGRQFDPFVFLTGKKRVHPRHPLLLRHCTTVSLLSLHCHYRCVFRWHWLVNELQFGQAVSFPWVIYQYRCLPAGDNPYSYKLISHVCSYCLSYKSYLVIRKCAIIFWKSSNVKLPKQFYRKESVWISISL